MSDYLIRPTVMWTPQGVAEPSSFAAGAGGSLHLDMRTDFDHEMHVFVIPGAKEAVLRPSGRAARPNIRSRTGSTNVGARGATRIRRYAVANGLNTFVTLTYSAPPAALPEVAHDVSLAVRRARRAVGNSTPYVFVPEGGDARLHAHVLCHPAFGEALSDTWAQGHVDIRRRNSVEEQRATAAYVAKGLGQARSEGLSRAYEVARGFEVHPIRACGSAAEIEAFLFAHIPPTARVDVSATSWGARSFQWT